MEHARNLTRAEFIAGGVIEHNGELVLPGTIRQEFVGGKSDRVNIAGFTTGLGAACNPGGIRDP